MGRGASGRESGNALNGSARATLDTQREHERAIDRLRDARYEDGTYDVQTLSPVSYNRGYQVTFCQIGDNYTREQYMALVNEFLRHTSDMIVSAGKFGGDPEISFHFPNRATALRFARRFNQISVWDWKNGIEIRTGGTGRR